MLSTRLRSAAGELGLARAVLEAGDRVLIVDDLLATGGTAAAACALVENLGARVVGLCVAVELTFLEGRRKLEGRRVEALVGY